MKVITTICHSQLVSMLCQPERFENAVVRYTSTAPDIKGEGINGYMEVEVEFVVRDMTLFAALLSDAYRLPSDRPEWYHKLRRGFQ